MNTNPFNHLPVFRSPDGAASAGQQEASYLSVAPSLVVDSGTPNEEQFAEIRSRFGDPRANVKPDDYYVFRLIAAGDGLDSYYTRQDVDTSFKNMARDLHKGQSVLGSHQMATFSYGSSFAGEIATAEADRAEYEPTFYPQWDTPELRTKNWLVGEYFIGRGLTLNGEKTDDIIRSLELGNVRKVSVSFMVGSYVCGIDGRDLIPSMFGPMPDEECNHFPGVVYDGQPAWALMKNNTLVETSLVYKNASPSSMLLRKAESMAERGLLQVRDIERLEQRFQVRLPRFEQRAWALSNASTSSGANTATYTTTSTSNAGNATTVQASPTSTSSTWFSGATSVAQEEEDMADRRRRAGDDATREMVRAALSTDPEPEEDVTPADDADSGAEAATTTQSESTDDAETREVNPDEAETTEAEADAAGDESAASDAGEEADAGDDAAESTTSEEVNPDASIEGEPDVPTVNESPDDAESRHKGHTHGGDDKGGHRRKKVEPEAAVETEGEGESDSAEAASDANPIAEFVIMADRLASALTRNPAAFDSASLAEAARAERAVDLALIDADCDTTVGARVAQTFETRSRALREALGEQLTVEAIRSLKARADLGEALYEDLVKDAVAARTSVQGEGFNSEKYRDLLLSARDVAFVKEETASWKAQKSDKFAPGRSVTPRQPIDTHTRAEDRKSLPEAPIGVTASKAAAPARATNIFDKRSK